MVEYSLAYVDQTLADIKRQFGVSPREDIISSLKEEKKAGLQRGIKRLIYLDIALTTYGLKENEPISADDFQRSLKVLYMKYLLLAEGTVEKRVKSHQAIRNYFSGYIKSCLPLLLAGLRRKQNG